MRLPSEIGLLRLVVEIIACVAGCEILVMFLLPWLAPHLGEVQEAMLDAFLLSILAGPLITWRFLAAFGSSLKPAATLSSESRFVRQGAVALVLLIGVAASLTGGMRIYQVQQAQVKGQFDLQAASLENAVQARFDAILPALKGMRSTLSMTGGQMSRAAFSQWVASRGLATDVAGVRGLGLIDVVPKDKLDGYVAQQQADQAPDFKVRSSGRSDALMIIRDIEPRAANKAAWGFDVGSEPTRRQAVEQAIRTGQPTLTGRIVLLQDGQKRPGFLYLLPVFPSGWATETPNDRETALIGLVYSPVVMEELLASVVRPYEEHLSVSLYDGQVPSTSSLYFDNLARLPAADQGRLGKYAKLVTLNVGQRKLSMLVRSTIHFDADYASAMPLWFGGTGVMLSGLIAVLLWVSGASRERAEAQVQARTQDLVAAQERAMSAVREKQSLFDALNRFTLVSVTNPQGDIIQVNDGFCEISGFAREELLGQQNRIINSGLHDESFWQEMWRTISSGQPWSGDVCNRAKDGHLYWVHSVVAPQLDGQGRVERFVSVRMDISESKRLELERANLTERLALAIEGASDGLWDWPDVLVDTLWLSPQFFRLLGYAAGELELGWASLMARLHADDAAHTQLAFNEAVQAGVPVDVEFRMRTKQGAYRWYWMRAKAHRDAQGMVHRLSGSIQDIHERRLAEFDLADRAAQMRSIFSLTPDGFVAFDEAGQVSYVSPSFERLTGIPNDLAMDTNEDTLFKVLINQAMEETLATHFSELPKTLAMRPPGVSQVAVAWHEGHGAVSKMLHLRDVSQEAELDRMKSTFMSMAAHELRTPMASIYGFTELLLTREFQPNKQRDLLQRILRQSEGMIEIINELLDLSRLEAKMGSDFHFEDAPLFDVIGSVVSDYKVPSGREQPLVQVEDADVRVCIDVQAAKRVLLNVLSNAYKYSPQGGNVTIGLRAVRPSDRHVAVIVRDEGIGMTPEQLARVGERFYRADKTGNIPGTGLGMAIVSSTLMVMDGSIEIDSEYGKGTTVTLWFPLAQDELVSGNAPLDALEPQQV